jgi:hypothetical protein
VIPEGKYKARGVEGALSETSKGNPQVAILIEIIEGEHAGENYTWYGHFTEKTEERTLESLRHLGWSTDDLTDLTGIDANEVSITIGHEDDQEGKTRARVRWVNAPGGLAIKERMNDGAAKQFAARMKGAAIASRQKASGGAKSASSGQSRQSSGGYGGGQSNGRRPPADEPNPFGADDFPKDGIPF